MSSYPFYAKAEAHLQSQEMRLRMVSLNYVALGILLLGTLYYWIVGFRARGRLPALDSNALLADPSSLVVYWSLVLATVALVAVSTVTAIVLIAAFARLRTGREQRRADEWELHIPPVEQMMLQGFLARLQGGESPSLSELSQELGISSKDARDLLNRWLLSSSLRPL